MFIWKSKLFVAMLETGLKLEWELARLFAHASWRVYGILMGESLSGISDCVSINLVDFPLKG